MDLKKSEQLADLSADGLSVFFGFRPPQDLVAALQSSTDVATANGISVAELWEGALGFSPAGPTCAYDSTPTELRPIGRTGAGGVHVGLIDLAPELEAPDLAMGTWSPMDQDDGVCSIRPTVWAGRTYELGRHIHYGRDWPTKSSTSAPADSPSTSRDTGAY